MSSTSPASPNPSKDKEPVVIDTDSKEEEPALRPYSWMVKPCELYNEEYKDCKSFKDRFHQWFVAGEYRECNQWKEDYKNCLKWTTDKDEESLQNLIDSEKQRVRTRLKAHYANDTWEHRETPPEDWNKELPDSIKESYENSFLKIKSDELKSGEQYIPNRESYVFSEFSCSIS